MKKNRAIIHVITGDGKGKTTSALGLGLRAVGAEKRVAIVQFMKKPDTSEYKAIKKYKLPIDIKSFGIGFYKILGDKHSDAEHRKACQKAWGYATDVIKLNKYDLIILDEINVAIDCGLLDIDDIIKTLKPSAHLVGARGGLGKEVDIVLTGRNAHPKIKKIADLVSDVKCVKHYFDKGVKSRKGIEF